jgi:hypothetical protein
LGSPKKDWKFGAREGLIKVKNVTKMKKEVMHYMVERR